ncbi:hypothetical protein [Actinoplanes sp. G11-F43]|uniref:hypothetical protein n=1 Tax=Actinoplanes sp. G11-F43 TaxID=3424130 RepID=UPI003D33673B
MNVSAEWDDPASEGPQRVTVTAGEITSRTLRRAGRLVDEMTAEFHEMPSVGAYRVMVRQYAEDRLAELPADGFHRGLLDLYHKIDDDGRVEPVATLAAAMRMPEESVRACLRVARQRVA